MFYFSLVQRAVNYLLELLVYCGKEKRNKRMWGNVEIEMTAVSGEEHHIYENSHH